MTQQGTDPPSNVVSGIVLLSDIRARTLFDTRASHSFNSRTFARTHGFEERPLPNVLSVLTPWPPIEADTFVPTGTVKLGNRVCPWDLAVVPIREFDLVLGMDWLTRYHVVFDCERRRVHLREPGYPKLVFQACKSMFFTMYISATQARRLIQGGCSVYLALVDLVTRPSPSLSGIPIVRKFQDIFPDELPGMTPERERLSSQLSMLPGPYRFRRHLTIWLLRN